MTPTPQHPEPARDGDYAGYAEFYNEAKLKEAVEDIVRQCGGNRFIAHGMAVEMVREVTGVRRQ